MRVFQLDISVSFVTTYFNCTTMSKLYQGTSFESFQIKYILEKTD